MPYATPQELYERLDLGLGGDEVIPCDYDRLFELLKGTMDNSIITNSPLFMNRLWSAAELAGVVAEWLVATLNTSAGAWDVSPVFVVMEREVIKQFLHVIGYTNGCGVMTPGGSTGNLYAIHVAREKALSEGHSLSDLVCVTSVSNSPILLLLLWTNLKVLIRTKRIIH